MKLLVFVAAAIALAGAMVVNDDFDGVVIGKDTMVNMDLKTKELMILKLLNHILQPTMYKDVLECSRDFKLDLNMDRFMNYNAVKIFMKMYQGGMLPRGEIFVHTNDVHMNQAMTVFHMLYFAKDFDTFIRCCCWLRERVNEGIFVYALTVAVLHRDDCRGIILPAPYEIYPFYFINSDVIHKAFMMKMKRGVIDPVLLDYYKIHVTDKNVCVIDSRKDLRHTISRDDRLTYFTEDIDLNTYFYYFHMDYPAWMTDDMFLVNKERRGEIMMYSMMQLLARYRLERLSHGMCDVTPINWFMPIKTGYWPKLRLHNGEDMPLRMNDVKIMNEHNTVLLRIIDDLEKMIRTAILVGRYELRDGTIIKIQKPEDIEILCRLVLTNMSVVGDNKIFNLMDLMRKMFTYNMYNINKYTYVPTVMDMYTTNLRDPVFWKLMKRITEVFVLFKETLPMYTRDDLDFPGVKVEGFTTDKLVTFIDEYDMDITNGVYLDKTELKKMKSDMLMVVRQRRLNHHDFKLTIDVVSDKTVDAVVRVFLGPKYDCMGRLLDLTDKRLDMFEFDSFIYKLETGKNTIVRDSKDMHNVIGDRMWTRKLFDRTLRGEMSIDGVTTEAWWHRSRTGFPQRLLLPMGTKRGLELQMFVIVSPVRTGLLMKDLDLEVMKTRKVCRYTTCMDTMPLGFPFDRPIGMSRFMTLNMKFTDVIIFHKDMDTINVSKNMDFSDLVMKRDDLTWMDRDMLVRSRFTDPMLMDGDRMMDLDRDVDRMI